MITATEARQATEKAIEKFYKYGFIDGYEGREATTYISPEADFSKINEQYESGHQAGRGKALEDKFSKYSGGIFGPLGRRSPIRPIGINQPEK